jgi:type IV pilus assembly protein PilM
MLNAKSFLAVDFGATNLKVAEFEVNEAGGLLMRQYAFRSLGAEGMQDTVREPAVVKALQELLSQAGFRSKFVNVCAPGFNTFSRFVKLPPVDTAKVPQIIQYEAQQNVPFPLEEVVWDYQILGATGEELEVLLVAIKVDIVEGLFRMSEAAGLRTQLVDVSTAALCNAFRFNYPDMEGCSILLDIGAKTSNLLFFEGNNMYSRGISIGAHAITQDFARETRLAFDEAERLKIEEGFVSLGGAYEEPDNPNQAAISKIARQVMTRLHIQVNQSIQFYRNQQRGSQPQRLFLAGGASLMPYTAEFFSEKLGLAAEAVEYFNPFRNVQIDDSLNREELAKVAHSLGEVVGLGLRNVAHCPVELNLMPKSSLQRQQFNQKKPFVIAAVFCLVFIVLAFGVFNGRVAAEKQKALDNLTARLQPLQGQQSQLDRAMNDLRSAESEAENYMMWMEDRFYWAGMLSQLRDVLIAVENKKEEELKAKTGVWVESMVPVTCDPTNAPAGGPMAGPAAMRRGGPRMGPGGGGEGAKEICSVTFRFKGKNLKEAAAAANQDTAYAVNSALLQMEYFDTNSVTLTGNMTEDAETFGFEINARLKRPIRY